MDYHAKELHWAALQIDDLAVLLRAWGFEEMASQFDAAHDKLQKATLPLESAA